MLYKAFQWHASIQDQATVSVAEKIPPFKELSMSLYAIDSYPISLLTDRVFTWVWDSWFWSLWYCIAVYMTNTWISHSDECISLAQALEILLNVTITSQMWLFQAILATIFPCSVSSLLSKPDPLQHMYEKTSWMIQPIHHWLNLLRPKLFFTICS